MFEKFGWKQITKSKIIQHQYDTKKTKKRVKTPPPGFSVLLGQKKLPKGDPPVRNHTFILLTGYNNQFQNYESEFLQFLSSNRTSFTSLIFICYRVFSKNILIG